MNALLLFLVLQSAQAEPGRLSAGADLGSAPGARLLVHASADYGVLRHLSLVGEMGSVPTSPETALWSFDEEARTGAHALALGGGILLAPIDGEWWRIGILGAPQVLVPLGTEVLPGLPLGDLDSTLALRTGLRVNWLAFWGLSFTGRLDRMIPIVGSAGWSEAGVGLAVRM